MWNSEPLVCLQAGIVVPAAAFNLALRCEAEGIALTVGLDGKLSADGPDGKLTSEIVSELKRLKPHIVAVLRYVPNDRHLRDDSAPRPELGPVVVSKVERNRGL